jgi:hypothetical protein
MVEVLVSRLLRRELRAGALAEPFGDVGRQISERAVEIVVRPVLAELRVERVDRAGIIITIEGQARACPEMSLGSEHGHHRARKAERQCGFSGQYPP